VVALDAAAVRVLDLPAVVRRSAPDSGLVDVRVVARVDADLPLLKPPSEWRSCCDTPGGFEMSGSLS
jgi:hypothetical protein